MNLFQMSDSDCVHLVQHTFLQLIQQLVDVIENQHQVLTLLVLKKLLFKFLHFLEM